MNLFNKGVWVKTEKGSFTDLDETRAGNALTVRTNCTYTHLFEGLYSLFMFEKKDEEETRRRKKRTRTDHYYIQLLYATYYILCVTSHHGSRNQSVNWLTG